MSLGLNARRRRTTLLLEGIGLPQTLGWRDFRLTAFTVLLDGRLSDPRLWAFTDPAAALASLDRRRCGRNDDQSGRRRSWTGP